MDSTALLKDAALELLQAVDGFIDAILCGEQPNYAVAEPFALPEFVHAVYQRLYLAAFHCFGVPFESLPVPKLSESPTLQDCERFTRYTLEFANKVCTGFDHSTTRPCFGVTALARGAIEIDMLNAPGSYKPPNLECVTHSIQSIDAFMHRQPRWFKVPRLADNRSLTGKIYWSASDGFKKAQWADGSMESSQTLVVKDESTRFISRAVLPVIINSRTNKPVTAISLNLTSGLACIPDAYFNEPIDTLRLRGEDPKNNPDYVQQVASCYGLDELFRSPELRCLSLHSFSRGLDKLLEYAPLEGLDCLVLSHCHINKRVCQRLAELKNVRILQVEFCSGIPHDSTSFDVADFIAGVQHMKQLQALSFMYNSTLGDVTTAFAGIKHLDRLKVLFLRPMNAAPFPSFIADMPQLKFASFVNFYPPTDPVTLVDAVQHLDTFYFGLPVYGLPSISDIYLEMEHNFKTITAERGLSETPIVSTNLYLHYFALNRTERISRPHLTDTDFFTVHMNQPFSMPELAISYLSVAFSDSKSYVLYREPCEIKHPPLFPELLSKS